MKRFQVFNAVALIFVGGLELGAALRFLRQVLIVVAGVKIGAAVPEFEDAVDGNVEGNSGREKPPRRHGDSR